MEKDNIKILSVGGFSDFGISNTCLHRNWALEKLGYVTTVDTSIKGKRLVYRIMNRLFVRYHIPVRYTHKKANKNIIEQCRKTVFDLIWIDKGVFIHPQTLKTVRHLLPDVKIVEYSPDNMVERHNQTRNFLECLPLIDYFVTTKSYNIEDLKKMGCKNVIFVNNAYEDTFHHPYALTQEEKKRLGGKVGFIGMWEKERYESILYLAEHGVPVRVWGGGEWLQYKNVSPNLIIEDTGLFSEDYNKALSAFDISLCFLRKINFDLQTTRTMEIPACGSLLMAEDTDEHRVLFENGKEAVFFNSNEELLKFCQYYLLHKKERIAIAKAGRVRCERSGYSNLETIRKVINQIFE